MTPEYKTNLMRIVLPLVAVLAGTLLTALAFLFAGFASAACHCSRPIAVAFPYATILWSMSRWESLGGLIMAFQFPVYAVFLAIARSRPQRTRYALILVAVHAIAVVFGLLVYKG